MRVLSLFICFVLVLSYLFLAAASTATTHACMSDDAQFAANVEADLAKEPRPINLPKLEISGEDDLANRNQGSGSYNKMRIVISTVDLDDGSRYCQAAGQLRPNYLGQLASCEDKHVLTSAKRDFLNKIIKEELSDKLPLIFRVNSLAAPLKVGSTSQCSGGFSIPSSHVTNGVVGADYILYVAAGPTFDNIFGFAGGCQLETGRDGPRIIVGKMNINPTHLTAANERQIRATVLHEWMHAGGFIKSRFEEANLVQTQSFRGISKRALISPRALLTARNFFDCNSMTGVELENEAGSGTRENHLDPRVYREDLMSGIDFHFLSTITLAIMEDLGVYRVNYTNAKPIIFGKNAGCGFLTQDCKTSGGGLGTFWCTPSSGNVDCTSDYQGYGNCVSAPELTDGCSFYRADQRHCTELATGSLTYNVDNGESYGAQSRCFATGGTFKNASSSASLSANLPRCFDIKCNETGTLYFRVGADADTWTKCSSNSESVSVSGFSGTVTCPSSLTDACRTLQASGDQAVLPQTTGWTIRPKPRDGGAGAVEKSILFIAVSLVCTLVVVNLLF